jgi:hypothetical protein
MFVVVPFVAYVIVFLYRDLLNTCSIQTVINFGFSAGLLVYGVGLLVAFAISLVSLAYQHS